MSAAASGDGAADEGNEHLQHAKSGKPEAAARNRHGQCADAMTNGENVSRHLVTFETAATGRDNNLNLLRMIAATAVLFSHSYALTGHVAEEPVALRAGTTDLATLGVIVFFAISGFLIAQSLTRNRSLYAYAVNRALRIVPALAVGTLFCVIVGWIATTRSTAGYWQDPATWRYLLGTPILIMLDRLPGVFATNPYPLAVNGSLWTIPLEVCCYAVAAVVAALRILQSRLLFATVAACALIAFSYFPDRFIAWIPPQGTWIAPRLAGAFLLGASVFVYRRFVPVSIVSALIVLVAAKALANTPYGGYAFYAAIAYAALVFAYHPRLRVRAYLKLGDYSYGTYVLAFPIQQLLVWRLGIREPLTLFVLALVATVALAVLSWHFVEAPALARKRRWGAWRPFAPLGQRTAAKP